MDRQFIFVKELNGELSNVSVQTEKQLKLVEVSDKRVVVWETKQPRRLMGRIGGVYKKSHLSGSMYAVSFDELYAFMKSDRAVRSLLVPNSKSSGTDIFAGILAGCIAGVAVLAYIAWGITSALILGVLATIVLGKK